MILRLAILGLVFIAACSGAEPIVESTEPSTILLPAVAAESPLGMFIDGFDVSTSNDGPTWVAQVVILVRDGHEELVAGAVISGEWSEGDTETVACTTDEDGVCELKSVSLRKRVAHVELEITGVEHENLTYLPGLDAVAAPDELPRIITVPKP